MNEFINKNPNDPRRVVDTAGNLLLSFILFAFAGLCEQSFTISLPKEG